MKDKIIKLQEYKQEKEKTLLTREENLKRLNEETESNESIIVRIFDNHKNHILQLHNRILHLEKAKDDMFKLIIALMIMVLITMLLLASLIGILT